MLRGILTDRFIQLLVAVMILANVVPARGEAATIVGWITTVGIFLLFFVNGIRLHPAEVLNGIRNWRLQGGIFLWVFGAMGLAGWAAGHAATGWVPAGIATGLIFLGILPTTVQSAIAYSSLAGGNVAASVVAAAMINLAGIVISPLLFVLLASTAGIGFSSDMAVSIATTLLLPFVLGQLLRRWLEPLIVRIPAATRIMDRTVIALAVYSGFSGAVVSGIWAEIDLIEMVILTGFVVLMLIFAFGGAWWFSGRLGLAPPDRLTMLFAGAHKSLTVGVPLSALMFDGPTAGMVLFAVLTYHLLQMVVSAVLAVRLRWDEKQAT